MRYRQGITYGEGTAEDNLQGVKDSREMPQRLEEVPEDFYARALD